RPAGCLACRRLRSAERLRQNFSETEIADAETTDEARGEMAPVSLPCGLVFLARVGEDSRVTKLKTVTRVTTGVSLLCTLVIVTLVTSLTLSSFNLALYFAP